MRGANGLMVVEGNELEYFEQVHNDLDAMVEEATNLCMQLNTDYEDAKTGDIPADRREIKWREKLVAKVDMATMHLDEVKSMISERIKKGKEATKSEFVSGKLGVEDLEGLE